MVQLELKDRKEWQGVRGLLPPQLAQGPPPPPATTIATCCKSGAEVAAFGRWGGAPGEDEGGKSGCCRGMESQNEALQQLSTAIFKQAETSIPSQALFGDMSLSLRKITPAVFLLSHDQAESFPQNS